MGWLSCATLHHHTNFNCFSGKNTLEGKKEDVNKQKLRNLNHERSWKYLLWNVILLILVILLISVAEAIGHCLSNRTKSSFIFWRATVVGKGTDQVMPPIVSKTSGLHPQVRSTSHWPQPAQSSQDSPILYQCKVQNLCHVFLMYVKLVVSNEENCTLFFTKVSFGVFCQKNIFTPQKIHVPWSIKL